jgi:hypothetical protein
MVIPGDGSACAPFHLGCVIVFTISVFPCVPQCNSVFHFNKPVVLKSTFELAKHTYAPATQENILIYFKNMKKN